MNTTTPDPATLRALSVTRKQDRVIMRDTLRTICDHPGITFEIREENRSVTARISSDSGLCATFCISPRYLDTVIHWFMHREVKGTIRRTHHFDTINESHRHKATKVCADFLKLCEHLEAVIASIRTGQAVILPTINTIHPAKQQPTNTTNMQTLQPNPANTAKRYTGIREAITDAAAILRNLFQADNDAPRLFAEQFADVLTDYDWSDPETTHEDIEEIQRLTEERDDLRKQLDEAETHIENLEARIEELEAELEAELDA
jgi:hypothetical protein